MQLSILGPLMVCGPAGELVEISGTRLRALVGRLAVAAPRPVSAGALVDAIWGDSPPADEMNALQSLVSRLRRTIGAADCVQQDQRGYRLSIEPDDLDLNRFERLARSGHAALLAGDLPAAQRDLAEAAELWRDAPGEDVVGTAIRARLDELYLEAISDQLEAAIRLGDTDRPIADLEKLIAEHPLRERFAALHVRALADAGRSAEALVSFERTRARLADELGIDPSPQLQAVHLAILRDERQPVARTNNLRAALTSFVGREEELARIGKLLDEGRLVTLVGPGGAGKTRLASEAAERLDVADGIWFAELAPVADPADVPQTVLGAVGLREATLIERKAIAPRDASERLVDALADRTSVIVLDNCEHVVDAAAYLADHLLTRCPRLRILCTSREPLGITGEALVVVPPLGQPDPDATAEQALAYPAARLFADRAAAVRADFTVDASTVGPVVEIVRRLDGLPLAIELAAARLRSLPIEQIAMRLSDRFRLLTGGSRTALPRHRTLHAVVEWSWELLTDSERRLCGRLAVFAGGITPESAAGVVGDEVDADQIEELIVQLADKSLLQLVPGTAARYRMLETIREFGLERLADAGEVALVRRGHARFFAALAVGEDTRLRGSDQLSALAILSSERDNLLAALKFLSDDGQASAALELAIALTWSWMITGGHGDAATWLGVALDTPGPVDGETRLLAEGLQAINATAWDARGGHDEVQQSLDRLASVGDHMFAAGPASHPMLTMLKPIVAMFLGRDEQVQPLLDAALSSPDPWTAAAVRMFRASMAENVGDLATMRSDAELALAAFRELGERWGMANSLQALAQIHVMDGRLDQAAAEYTEALELAGVMGAHDDETMMRLRLADVLMRLGDDAGAKEQAARAGARNSGSHAPIESIFTNTVLAEVARLSGDVVEGRRLRDLSLAQLEKLPAVHPVQGHAAAVILSVAAKFDLDDGDLDAARARLIDAHATAIGTKDMPVVAQVALAVALYAVAVRDDLQPAEILGAAARLRGGDDPTQPEIKKLAAKLSERFGDAAYEQAYARGRALDKDAAIARTDPASL